MGRHGVVTGFVAVAALMLGSAREARADGEGIGQAVGLAAGGITALVLAPIAGGVASAASPSSKVRFWPTTGIAFGGAVVLGALGVALGAAAPSGSTGVWAPSVGAAFGAIGGACVWAAVNAEDPSRPPAAVSVTPVSGGALGSAVLRF